MPNALQPAKQVGERGMEGYMEWGGSRRGGWEGGKRKVTNGGIGVNAKARRNPGPEQLSACAPRATLHTG